jgi:hypothetical protein
MGHWAGISIDGIAMSGSRSRGGRGSQPGKSGFTTEHTEKTAEDSECRAQHALSVIKTKSFDRLNIRMLLSVHSVARW